VIITWPTSQSWNKNYWWNMVWKSCWHWHDMGIDTHHLDKCTFTKRSWWNRKEVRPNWVSTSTWQFTNNLMLAYTDSFGCCTLPTNCNWTAWFWHPIWVWLVPSDVYYSVQLNRNIVLMIHILSRDCVLIAILCENRNDFGLKMYHISWKIEHTVDWL